MSEIKPTEPVPVEDGCEWDQMTCSAANDDSHHSMYTPAEWLLGANGAWRLCDGCATLPQFARFRVRKKIERKVTT